MKYTEFPDKVIIKQKPDEYAIAVGLSKYNKSKLPQCIDRLQVIEFNGRFITGIDENSYDIMRIYDDVARNEKQEEIKKLREYLEKAINKDLSATSDFWKTFTISISSDSDLVLNKTNPYDVIRFYALIANRYAAPSKREVSNPEFLNCKYYAFFEDVEKNEEVTLRKKRDKARGKLLDISEDKNLMILYGQYLEGFKYRKELKTDTLYEMLANYIDSKDLKNAERFLKAIEKPLSEIQFKVNIDRAIKKKVVKYRDGYYQRGNVTLGKSIDDVYKNLSDPEFAMEYHSIKEELEEL